MSRRSGRATTLAFAALAEGTQNGLRCLVSDNATTVATMLDMDPDSSTTDVLCEKCAQVMRQQQLSVSSFLARFFPAEILSKHAVLWGKSGKGSAAVLADRIALVWLQNKSLENGDEISTPHEKKVLEGIDLKRKTKAETKDNDIKPKETKDNDIKPKETKDNDNKPKRAKLGTSK
jgi:hypothetical protein